MKRGGDTHKARSYRKRTVSEFASIRERRSGVSVGPIVWLPLEIAKSVLAVTVGTCVSVDGVDSGVTAGVRDGPAVCVMVGLGW